MSDASTSERADATTPAASEAPPTRLGLALGWTARVALVLVGLSPFFPPLLGDVPGLSWLAAGAESWFEYQCHRDPARSLHVVGWVLPVCVRCSGIYFGLGLGALILRPRLGAWPLRLWVGGAALVMILDVATETLGMRPEYAPLRLVTGMLLAYPVAAAIVWTLRSVGSAEAA